MPSVASYSRREAAQLARLVFFLDHQIGRHVVAEALRGFVMTGHGMRGDDMAALLERSLPGMIRKVAGRMGPLMFSILRGGTFGKLIER